MGLYMVVHMASGNHKRRQGGFTERVMGTWCTWDRKDRDWGILDKY